MSFLTLNLEQHEQSGWVVFPPLPPPRVRAVDPNSGLSTYLPSHLLSPCFVLFFLFKPSSQEAETVGSLSFMTAWFLRKFQDSRAA